MPLQRHAGHVAELAPPSLYGDDRRLRRTTRRSLCRLAVSDDVISRFRLTRTIAGPSNGTVFRFRSVVVLRAGSRWPCVLKPRSPGARWSVSRPRRARLAAAARM